MVERFSDVISRTLDEDKRQICAWCGSLGTWVLLASEGDLVVYCCSEEHQQALQQALQ
jgi:hypothetical protein